MAYSPPMPERHDRWANTPVPPAIANPPAVAWVEWIVFAGGLSVILYYGFQSLRTRRQTYYWLFLINSLLCYWMETIGDWGQHLVYSPRFVRHTLLEWLPLKSPNDPLLVPFAYASYWTFHSILLMYFAPKLQSSWKGLSLLQAVIILSFPINYTWDIITEGTATYFGYWTYDPGFGPVIQWPGGGRQPLTWPILLMTGWPNLIAYWAGKPPLYKLNIIEKLFHLDRFTAPKEPISLIQTRNTDDEGGFTEQTALLSEDSANPLSKTAGFSVKEFFNDMSLRDRYDAQCDYQILIPVWKFELLRFGAWFITFQVSFFVTLVIPLVVMRYVTGKESIYVP